MIDYERMTEINENSLKLIYGFERRANTNF